MITFEQFQNAKTLYAVDERDGQMLTLVPYEWKWNRGTDTPTIYCGDDDTQNHRPVTFHDPAKLFIRRSDMIADAILQTKAHLKKLEGLLEKAIEAEGVDDALEAHAKGLL